jgi:hypothetical protein
MHCMINLNSLLDIRRLGYLVCDMEGQLRYKRKETALYYGDLSSSAIRQDAIEGKK